MKFLLVLLCVFTASAALAQEAPLSWGRRVPVDPADSAQVQAVIARQLSAFRQHDDSGAYAETAPNIRRRFPTAAGFVAMAQVGYAPLLQSDRTTFTSIRGAAATPTESETWNQTATIVSRDGEAWTATYDIERQPDGTLKITSCVIVRSAAGAA